MSFFKAPPILPEDAREPPAAWLEPSADEVGVTVPIDNVIFTSLDAAVVVLNAIVYEQGMELLVKFVVPDYSPGASMSWFAPVAPGSRLNEEVCRLGVEFSDGSTATNLDEKPWAEALADGDEPGAVMIRAGGRGRGIRGRGYRSSFHYWIWPIPPEGTLRFACEWPAMGIPLTFCEVTAEPFRIASRHVKRFW